MLSASELTAKVAAQIPLRPDAAVRRRRAEHAVFFLFPPHRRGEHRQVKVIKRLLSEHVPSTGDYAVDERILVELDAMGVRTVLKPLWLEDLVALVKSLTT
jgi:hypothetical protein